VTSNPVNELIRIDRQLLDRDMSGHYDIPSECGSATRLVVTNKTTVTIRTDGIPTSNVIPAKFAPDTPIVSNLRIKPK
jgi:hypothetical protein